MKTLILLAMMAISTNLYSEEGCKQIGELNKCEIEVSRHLIDLGKCKLKPSSNSGAYEYGYFSVGEKVLKITWLEDAGGLIDGTLSKRIVDDYKTVETDRAWYYSSGATSRCKGKRDVYKLRLESKIKVLKLIKDFLKN
jgi:hypothetical protein